MKICIDYLPFIEQVHITSDLSDKAAWKALYNIICDYLPIEVISYSEMSIDFPWRYFLNIKYQIGSYVKSHNDIYECELTPLAKQKLLSSNDTSYTTSTSLAARSESEVVNRLNEAGFIRKPTVNQLNNLIKISHLPGAATFSVPGAGKTTEALAYFFINALPSDRLLVVAPKNAFTAWDEQMVDCMGEGYDEFARLRGGEEAICCILNDNPRFMLITYDQLARVRNAIIGLLASGNVYMFLDESHRIKGGKQVKRADAILDMSHLPKRKLIMSGTPMPQSSRDLIPQFKFLYPTKTVTEKDVIDTIRPIFVRTTKGELGIPKLEHKVVMVQMSQPQREIYKMLKSELCRQMSPALTDTSRFALRQIGKCTMKIMQFVSNPALLVNDISYAFNAKLGSLLLQYDSPKIAYVCRRTRELVAEGKKVLIWSTFVSNVELVATRLADLGAEFIHGGVDAGDENDTDTREGKIKRFHNDPTCKVLVANPAACSEGISLHKVCQYAIYLDRSFNAAHYMQSEDRIHRLGLPKDAKPQIEFVECEDSVDQVIRARLEMKVDTMARALEDSSLSVAISSVHYDEEVDDCDALTEEDAKAVLKYFFGNSQS